MPPRLDLVATAILAASSCFLALVYSFRVVLKGKAHFERVDRQDHGVLLGKSLMEMAHWGIEPLAKGLAAVGVTPNQLSWTSLVFGLGAGVALALGHFGIAALVSVFASFMDMLDGMVARNTGVASDAGEVLDAAVDRYVEFFFLGGLVVYYHERPLLQVLALLTLLGSFMVSYSTAKAEALKVDPPTGSMRRPERAVYLILGSFLADLSITFYEGGLCESHPCAHPPLALPMIVALFFVALVSNFSAVLRLHEIARAIRARE